MTSRMLALPFALGLLASFVACGGDDGGDVGAPCNVDADCASGLVCDEHEGQASCQDPHGHEEGEDTAHASETGHGTAEDTAHASESGGHETGHDSGHDSSETGHGSGETGSSTGA
jgi:hypothetical protein